MYLYDEIKNFVHEGELVKGIKFAEKELKRLDKSDFHKIISRDFLHLANNLYSFIDSNFREDDKLDKTRAFYSELNGFSINYDKWFLYIQAHDTREDYHDESSDWLCDGFWGSHNPECFVLKGVREIRKAFKRYYKNKNKSETLTKAATVCEYLVLMRLQELFDSVIHKGKENLKPWANLPWGITAHDYHIIHVIE